MAKHHLTSAIKPFVVHLILFKFAICSWRPYLVHQNQEVHQHTTLVLIAAPTGAGPIGLSVCGDSQQPKQLRDEILDTSLALSTTRDALNFLLDG